MPGEEDFTTKKSSKDFDRGGKREKKAEGAKKDSKPYETKKKGGMRKLTEKEKEVMKEVVAKRKLDKSGAAKLRMAVMRNESPIEDVKVMIKLVK